MERNARDLDGSKYAGECQDDLEEWRNGKQHGVYSAKDGGKFEGEWKE